MVPIIIPSEHVSVNSVPFLSDIRSIMYHFRVTYGDSAREKSNFNLVVHGQQICSALKSFTLKGVNGRNFHVLRHKKGYFSKSRQLSWQSAGDMILRSQVQILLQVDFFLVFFKSAELMQCDGPKSARKTCLWQHCTIFELYMATHTTSQNFKLVVHGQHIHIFCSKFGREFNGANYFSNQTCMC